jgi:hypothetical protein
MEANCKIIKMLVGALWAPSPKWPIGVDGDFRGENKYKYKNKYIQKGVTQLLRMCAITEYRPPHAAFSKHFRLSTAYSIGCCRRRGELATERFFQRGARCLSLFGRHGISRVDREAGDELSMRMEYPAGFSPPVVHYCPKIESARHLSRNASQFA